VKRWKIVATLFLCLALAGAVACLPFRGQGVEQEVAPQLVEVVRGDLIISVNGSGSIGVSNEAKVAFDGSGTVDRIYVDEGDVVKEGQALAVLAPVDTAALELALLKAQIALRRAEYNLDKAKNPYTEEEIKEAEEAVDEAEDYLDYVKHMLVYALGNQREAQQWQTELHQAEMNLEAAEDKLDEMLSPPDEDEIAILEMEVNATERAVKEAESELEIETITAPFYGIVTDIYVEEGDFIPSPTGPSGEKTIVHLIDLTTMELGVDLDEIDIPGVALDQRAIITVDALPEFQLEGRVARISPLPTVEAGVVLYKVKIGFDVPQGSGLKIGMSAAADIITNERSGVLLVPNRAIKQDSQGNPVVWVMVGEQVERRSVVSGISDGVRTEIIDGLEEGEIVVVELQAEPELETGRPPVIPFMQPAPPPER